MSYANSAAWFLLTASLAVGSAACSSAGADLEDISGELGQAATAEATVVFHANYTTEVRGTLERGKRLKVLYASSRARCQSTYMGNPAWSVTAWYRWNGGEVRSVQVAGMRSDPSAPEPGIALDATGDLEMWFQNNDRYGCNSFDSDFGKNYHFQVAASTTEPTSPGWVGNARYGIERATCDGRMCDGGWRSLEGGFTYDTWARQRAALRQVGFEVWKAGVTDHDNPELWRQLDVQVHRRFVGEPTFTTEYVSFDTRWGNNAHYMLDLRAIDPFEWPAGARVSSRADCPRYALRRDPSGQYVEADVELYFTVNGAELRPAGGGTFHGTFQDYLGTFAVCVTP